MLIECSICCDFMFSSDSASEDICATKCGHIYHEGCLSDWFQRSRHCPQCRTDLRKEDCIRLFMNSEKKTNKAPTANEQCRRSDENMTFVQLMDSILAENAEKRSQHLSMIKQHMKIECSIISLAKIIVGDSLKICTDLRRKLLYQHGSKARAADSSRVTEEKITEVLGDVRVFEEKIILTNESLIEMIERVDELQTGRMPHT